MWQSYLNGLLVAAGLIMAIGTQNAFVLAQSLRREHHLPVALLCIVCDALLIAAGVYGLANLLAQNPLLLAFARWGGVAFLVWYGSLALRRACSRRIAQRTGGDLAQPPRLSRYGVAGGLPRRATNGPRCLRGGRGQRVVDLVFDPGHRRGMARTLVGTPLYLASAGPDGGSDDV